ncbi:hypothetical protein L9F63_015692, partial [Diploptera punctata]
KYIVYKNRWCDSSRGAGCQRLNTKDVPRARRWLLVLASGPLSAFLWCVYGVSPARSHLRMSHCSLVFQSRCAAT